jgi:hypothetical protein
MKTTLRRRGCVSLASAVGLLGCGGGGSPPASAPISVQTDVAVADLDGDGRNDLALSGADGVVMLMRQSAAVAGRFEAPRPIR